MSADKARAFVDTNVFIYLYSGSDINKRHCSFDAMRHYDCVVSTQVLNEFCHVCIKKLKSPIEKIQIFINQICSYCGLAYVDKETVSQALEIHKKYAYSFYDSLIITSALESDCKYLLSEDMANGQIVEDRLIIKNIFI